MQRAYRRGLYRAGAGILALSVISYFAWKELNTLRFLSQAAYGPALLWAESNPAESFHTVYLQDAAGTVELGRFEDRGSRLKMMLAAWASDSQSVVALTCAGSANLVAYHRKQRRPLEFDAGRRELFRAYLLRDFKVQLAEDDPARLADAACRVAEQPFREKYRMDRGTRMIQLN